MIEKIRALLEAEDVRMEGITKFLPPFEKAVLRMRLDGTPTLEAVGQEFNVTRERIRLVESKVLQLWART